MKDPWVNYKGFGAFKELGAGGAGVVCARKKTREER